jgi:hypothetical protein
VHGAGHEKEFLHWSKLMGQNELAILAGFALAFYYLRKNRWIVFYGVFSFFVWLIYSLIPYKTPWCIISLLWPFAIVAGFGVDEFLKKSKRNVQALVLAGFAGLFIFESVQLYKLQFRDPIEMEHPFVYVNSTYQMKEFISKIQGMMKADPLLRERPVQIGAEESWPFPVVFSEFYTLNYQKYPVEVMPDAIIYIVDTKEKQLFEEKLAPRKAEYQNFLLETRQGRDRTLVYVKKDLFQNVFSWPLTDVGNL